MACSVRIQYNKTDSCGVTRSPKWLNQDFLTPFGRAGPRFLVTLCWLYWPCENVNSEVVMIVECLSQSLSETVVLHLDGAQQQTHAVLSVQSPCSTSLAVATHCLLVTPFQSLQLFVLLAEDASNSHVVDLLSSRQETLLRIA